MRVPVRGTGAEQPVRAMRVRNGILSKGAAPSRLRKGPTGNGRSPGQEQNRFVFLSVRWGRPTDT